MMHNANLNAQMTAQAKIDTQKYKTSVYTKSHSAISFPSVFIHQDTRRMQNVISFTKLAFCSLKFLQNILLPVTNNEISSKI